MALFLSARNAADYVFQNMGHECPSARRTDTRRARGMRAPIKAIVETGMSESLARAIRWGFLVFALGSVIGIFVIAIAISNYLAKPSIAEATAVQSLCETPARNLQARCFLYTWTGLAVDEALLRKCLRDATQSKGGKAAGWTYPCQIIASWVGIDQRP
jgi:hypothetical protein